MTEVPSSGPAVVAIGGGHGLAVSLRAVRTYARDLTAIVATGDDGGSSGRVRAELDMPAPGDLRRCITTIAPERRLADALEHRFGGTGDLADHAVGNLVLAGLVDAGYDLAGAARELSRWLGLEPTTMRVLPATLEPVCIVASTDEGEVRGQVAAEEAQGIKHIKTDPAHPAVPDGALAALDSADQIMLGPGSLYTSVLAPAAVPAIRKAITASTGQVVFVCNLRADASDVSGFDVGGHISVLVDHGIIPDVVVAQEDALPIGDLGGTKLVLADIDRPHGLAHDARLLGDVLSSLC